MSWKSITVNKVTSNLTHDLIAGEMREFIQCDTSSKFTDSYLVFGDKSVAFDIFYCRSQDQNEHIWILKYLIIIISNE